MCREDARVARTPDDCEHGNTIVFTPHIVIEYDVRDVRNCGVKCRAFPTNDSGAAAIVDQQGSASGLRRQYRGTPALPYLINGIQLSITSSRMKVTRAADGATTGKSMTGDAVAYRDEYYETESQDTVIEVVSEESEYENPETRLSHTGTDAHGINEIRVLWDLGQGRASRFAIDGEEIEIE